MVRCGSLIGWCGSTITVRSLMDTLFITRTMIQQTIGSKILSFYHKRNTVSNMQEGVCRSSYVWAAASPYLHPCAGIGRSTSAAAVVPQSGAGKQNQSRSMLIVKDVDNEHVVEYTKALESAMEIGQPLTVPLVVVAKPASNWYEGHG